MPDWLTLDEQRDLVGACREWAKPPAPMQRTRLPGGGMMSVQTVCLGWHWLPYRYSRIAENVDGQPVKPFPSVLAELGRRAVATVAGDKAAEAELAGTATTRAGTGFAAGPAGTGVAAVAAALAATASAGLESTLIDGYEPDAALINFYDDAAKMGLHQDKDERSLAPVVSLSLGDSCIFRFGNTEHRNRPYTDIELRSGDLFVFGGPSRLAFHGVTKILSGTSPAGIGLEVGRLNITLRVTGLV